MQGGGEPIAIGAPERSTILRRLLWRRYRVLFLSAVIALLMEALLAASRTTHVYTTVDGQQIDCGTRNDQVVELACFGRFDMFDLAQIVFPVVAAFAACIVGLQLLQLLPPPADAVGADQPGTEAIHPRAIRGGRSAELVDHFHCVAVDRHGAHVGRLRRQLAAAGNSTVALSHLNKEN